MPERLEPTEALVALLRDVRDRHVLEDEEECAPYLELPGDEPCQVGNAVWQMERAGWVTLPGDTLVWELTDAGRAVLKAGVP